MVLVYPLALAELADLLPIESSPFQPVLQREYSGLGTGEQLGADLGPRLWSADVVLRAVLNTEARALKARVEAALDGTFYVYDVVNAYPTHDPGGTTLGSATVTVLSVNADNLRLALQGLPAGYVLDHDLVAIDYGTPSRRTLVRMVGSVTAAVDGTTAEFEVRPALRPGIVTGCAVTLKKPAMKANIVPGSITYEQASARRTRIRFTALQTLQAG